ncbi:hypothetical protein [Nocardia carnea]|uniref:Uncharacterized protein n=1 Tax=Nocardia carnea TaxID=37328 RepID=A0ABW7U087_9NOCA|nr:hypothetical protein [Nocardia carnea]
MADTQDDAGVELRWDQRALTAADLVTDAQLVQAGPCFRSSSVSVAAPEPG